MFTHFSQLAIQLLKTSALLLLTIITTSALAIDIVDKKQKELSLVSPPWELWKQNKNLSIKYRKIPNQDLIEIHAQAKITSSLSAILLFLQDTKNIPRWLHNASYSEILKTLSSQENISKTTFDALWPIKNREMIIRSKYWQNENLSVQVVITDESVNYRQHTTNETIPINIQSAHWKITPLINNTVFIEHTIIADPMGSVPKWLANRMALKSMWETLTNIAMQLPKSSYQYQRLPNIKELPQN
ncbi:MAG: START domain-containing protein [Colwellia sp.]|nr:START domain-containing protein [Colwellia sp.]